MVLSDRTIIITLIYNEEMQRSVFVLLRHLVANICETVNPYVVLAQTHTQSFNEFNR